MSQRELTLQIYFLLLNRTFFPNVQVNEICEINIEENAVEQTVVLPPSEKPEGEDNPQSQDPKLWEGDSQFELLDSQQLAEGLALCDEFLLSQSQTSCGGGDEPRVIKPRLAVYAQLPAEDFKKDLEECQRLEPSDAMNLEFDSTTEFRLSQIVWSCGLSLISVICMPPFLLNVCSSCRIFHRTALRHGLAAR